MEKNATATTAPRILTFNMFMRPPGIKNNKNDFKNERLDFIVQNILPAYDIITVQEAFAYANRRIDRFLAAAFKQGFYYQVASSRHYPWDLAGDGGLLILSKYPIQKSDRIEFPRGVHSDWLSFKGALHALVEIDSTHSVHVYTTHTQASYDNNGAINFDDTKVRLSQFAAVHQFIADTAKEDSHPILLMGDLNVDAAAHDTDIDVPSRNSSLAYTMMMDVLIGKGTNLQLLVNDKNVSTVENKTSYGDDWHLDGLTDMAYKSFGYHPVTFGDYKKLDNGTLIPAETILTSHNQLMTVQSIDRLLWYGKNDTRMSVSHVVVENFFTKNDTTLPFTQISDHYGLSAVLECN
ncbi:Endonuclease/exonuclease/phosphatase [Mucor mucedo]|uniref:Endonuclease/exonuclease/phosphatase n=1 Tax=Mucor mucedo TaxID=29922 RepID=UPI002220BA19|nr:Endonuclease/exonuclease/phosphatase [Mucor mucedo]KAI7889118.1 Endonuclease/exonuclease/phosphatase [Mucor mucedo]